MHPQRLPAQQPGGEAIQVGQVRKVIDVQMREKDVVDRHNRHLHGDDIAEQPEPRSKKNRSPLPSSTIMLVPAWSRRGGKGQLPMKEIRISSGPSFSPTGK